MAAAPEAPQLVTEIKPEKPRTANRAAALFSAWVRDLVISLAISAFIIVFLYQPVKVEGTSMMPSLDDQERIFINKFVYRIEPIRRYCGVSLPERSGKEFYQASDRCCRRPRADRGWAGVLEWQDAG
jgi:signal peptidase I